MTFSQGDVNLFLLLYLLSNETCLRYEELTCRAALAIKSVDQLVVPGGAGVPREAAISSNSLQSPVTPDIEFDEDEVLNTCHNFLNDYGRSLAIRDSTPPSAISSEQRLKEQAQHISSVPAPSSLPTPPTSRIPPVPAPRHSLLSNGRARQVSPALSKEDEQLLAAAQGKSFWETQGQETVFDKIDNVNPEVFDSKIIRTRSSR